MKTPYTLHLLLLLLLLLPPTYAAAQENQTYITHTVLRGQTLYGIATMYHVSQSDIVNLNPGADRLLREGQTLRIPISERANTTPTYHTIVRGETLYGLCRQYHLTATQLCAANPGLSATNFRAGQVILIPPTAADTTTATTADTTPTHSPTDCRTTHTVRRRETIYSLCRQYQITQAQLIAANPQLQNGKLQRGTTLCIPYTDATTTQTHADTDATTDTPTTDEQLWQQVDATRHTTVTTLRIAVLLPLLPQDAQAGQSARMIEYYEGLLLAVDSLKRQGLSVDITTYSLAAGNEPLGDILTQADMQDRNLIFGPMDPNQIPALAAHATRTGARLIIPFTSRDNTVFTNPNIYQINTPQSYLYTEVYDHFLRQFPDEKIIFITADDEPDAKADFISGLQAELTRVGRTWNTVDDDDDFEQIALTADTLGNNLFIPTSGSNLTLIKILPQLTLLVRNKHQMTLKLFGYPEWQTYTADHIDTYFEVDTYFYTSFYTNDLLPAARQFTRNYRHWYGHDMEDRYPRYGMLGFDTAYYFLKQLATYADNLEQHVDNNNNITPIQTGFKFQRVNNWGGFINRKVFFVHFGNDYVLTKLDFDQP